MKILVIDDEENVLKSVKKVISSKHPLFEIDLVKSPSESINQIKKKKYDLVITDLMMPDIDGFEIMEKIQLIDPDVKIIVITGYATIKTYMDSIKSGANNFIPKPFTRNELLTAIKILF
jgi:DNA-binding NtrC family response regulator